MKIIILWVEFAWASVEHVANVAEYGEMRELTCYIPILSIVFQHRKGACSFHWELK